MQGQLQRLSSEANSNGKQVNESIQSKFLEQKQHCVAVAVVFRKLTREPETSSNFEN